jgi:predicted nuclease with TOPRIM domain
MVVAAILAACAGCGSKPPTATDRTREERAETARDAQKAAERARETLSKRLDELDNEIDKVEQRAKKATGKAKARLEEQGRELRADARKLRARMSTWDDKAESAWRTAKREVEEGLEKTQNAIKKLVDDIKD